MSREYRLKKIYGITLQQYDDLLRKQNYSCAICGQHYTKFKVSLAVEHDHVTKEIRGLCCSWCNRRVLGRHRGSKLLHAAAKYLDSEYTGWFVPTNSRKKKKRNKRK